MTKANPSKNETPSLDYWVKQLTQNDMPAFAHTARIIAGEASRDESSAARLAKFILQDPSMTVRLLKMANSPFFNPRQNSINTVSRAIVLLGFKTVKNLCLSISILDTLVEGQHKKWVLDGLADCFHAAIQARAIARHRKDKSPEEIFIAALLRQLGQFSFWTFSKKISKNIAGQLTKIMRDEEKLTGCSSKNSQGIGTPEKSVLGFTFDELTSALNKEWHISPLLDKTIAVNNDSDPRVTSIILAHEIARVSKKGWSSDEMKALLKRLSESLFMSVNNARTFVEKNADQAASTLTKLGASALAEMINTVESETKKDKVARPIKNDATKKDVKLVDMNGHAQRHTREVAQQEPTEFFDNDPNIQIQILSDINQLVEENPDLHLMIEMVLEGIYRGVGMDRVIFALLSPDKKQIQTKFAIGWDRQEVSQRFRFPVNLSSQDLFAMTLKKQAVHWVTLEPNDPLTTTVAASLIHFNQNTPFFLAHVSIGTNPIGVIYADRKPSQRKLDEASFASFKLFAQQASMGLLKIKQK